MALKVNKESERIELKINEIIRKAKEEKEKREFNVLIENFQNQVRILENPAESLQETKIYKPNKSIEIIPILKKDYDKYEVSFKIGEKRKYIIKSFSGFYKAYNNSENFNYGKNLSFIHNEKAFSEQAKPYANLISKYGELIEYAREITKDRYGYYEAPKLLNNKIKLNENNIEEFMECLKNSKTPIEIDKESYEFEFIEKEPEFEFEIKKVGENKYNLLKQGEIPEILTGNKKSYIINKKENLIYEFETKKLENEIKLLEIWKNSEVEKYIFNKEGLINFVNKIMPKLKSEINLKEIPKEEKEKYIPKELNVKMKLDLDEQGNILNKILFCYEDKEFDPIIANPQMPRRIEEEEQILAKIKMDGFIYNLNSKSLKMINEDDIFEFLTDKINNYMEKYEVLVTDLFKSKEIKQPKIQTMGIRIENNLLNIDLSGIEYDPEEIKEIMEKYKLKKKYHKLRNGEFLNLEKNNDLDFLENLTQGFEITSKDLAKGKIKLPVNRSLYLNKMLEQLPDAQITENKEYKELIDETNKKIKDENIKIPKTVEKVLRNYQKTGYKWLTVLDKYKFGGILADDMGLGKTLQLIAILLQSKKEKKPSIVVCPSSLTLNWKNEIEKFAKELKVEVIRGTANERKEKLEKVNNYNVIITSYDLLKRDIENYEKLSFKYVIADEAQYIKNSNTQNAKALKQLNSQTRYALTGTPIENSLAELWSIFDYIMPGYLFTYTKFKKEFESRIIKENDEKTMQRLKTMIEPFILRRTKKEVLTELPDKTITILNNEMEKEQQKVYLSYLARFKKEMLQTIEKEGFEKSQIKILSLLTRLRQICCHPSLFLEDYAGESSKLNQCTEIIEDAISSNHKILLFSNYTQMFPIIEEQLNKREVQYYKLTGSTKVDERIKMVDKFNKNKDIKVFLISLKAGGTGLNLTGADIVIHYDPWWNLSAENQATDRAYRIGQKNNVQVYKMITKNSIEEKIQELQEKKAVLVDNVLDTKQTFVNKLSKSDIISLFNA